MVLAENVLKDSYFAIHCTFQPGHQMSLTFCKYSRAVCNIMLGKGEAYSLTQFSVGQSGEKSIFFNPYILCWNIQVLQGLLQDQI